MLKLMGWIIKLSVFCGAVLVLGNLIPWRGRSVSDQVKTQMSNLERSGLARKAKSMAWGYPPIHSIRERIEKGPQAVKAGVSRPAAEPKRRLASDAGASAPSRNAEQIAPSEREKLRALINELNGPRRSNVSGNP